jgi:hypothetical protein
VKWQRMSKNFIYSFDHCRFAYFDLFDWIEKPYTIADAARWAGIGVINLEDTAADQNVLNIAAADVGKLASIQVGDPVWFRTNNPTWALDPVDIYCNDGTSCRWWFGSNLATVTAIGVNTLTLSRDLMSAITRDAGGRWGLSNTFILQYAHTDWCHLVWMASMAAHYRLFNPACKRYELYLGKLITTVDQSTAGRALTGGASVAGTSWEAAAWPPKPGVNRTADAIHDVTLGANNDAVRFPGATCTAGTPNVARFSVVSLNGSGKDTLQCWVEDGAAAVKSDVVAPNMYGGIDVISIPFTPTATGTHYLKIKQNGATDASCYLSEIEYRKLPADYADAVMPATGFILLQGDSNLHSVEELYNGLGTLPARLGTGRSYAEGSSGRHLALQAQEAINSLRQSAVIVSNETANAALQQHLAGNLDLTPVYSAAEAYTTAKFGAIAAYWSRYVGEWVPDGMVLFMSPARVGENTDHGWDITPIAADQSRQARVDLSL